MMFYNVSNHPSAGWGSEQKAAACALGGTITDVPFPAIDPALNAQQVRTLATQFTTGLLARLKSGDVVHVMGELCAVYAIVGLLLDHGVRCVASTTSRQAVELPDGTKLSRFRFVAFRDYL